MDKDSNNVLAACMLELEVQKILESDLIEADTSTASWADVNKSKLPKQCFLWVEDPKKKSTWHLPYREGTGGIDTETGMYKQAGAVNLNALRAIAAAVGGARTGTPMKLPTEIRNKVKGLLKRYNIGQQKQEGRKMDAKDYNFQESVFQDPKIKHDKENCIVYGVAILKNSSQNCSYKKGKGRNYSEQAMNSVVQLINGTKSYINHATRKELEERGGIRDLRDLLGFFENGRLDDNLARADFRYNPCHKKWFGWTVENMSDKIGASIHAYGPSTFDEQTLYENVQDIKVLRSADIVTEPGSTNNLFESLRRHNEEDMDISKLTLTDLDESRPELIQGAIKRYEESESVKKTIKEREDYVKKLEEENGTLKTELDEYKVKEAFAVKKASVLEKIEENKLPKESVTEIFIESLMKADEGKIDDLIKDRLTLIKTEPVVKGMGAETTVGSHDYTESVKDYGKAIEGYSTNG